MKNIYRISGIILLILSVHSCKKGKQGLENDNSISEKYTIEMKSDYSISKITYNDSNNVIVYNKTYYYLGSIVKVTETDVNNNLNRSSTYFLNRIGLADSCIDSAYNNSILIYIYRTKYQYNNYNYLTSFDDGSKTIHFEYENGNKTTADGIHYSARFQYNTLINIIDIDLFQGSYLGKLNKNLTLSSQYQFTMGSDDLSNVYQYETNSEGLVVQRIGTTTYNRLGSSPTKLTTKFEYLITN